MARGQAKKGGAKKAPARKAAPKRAAARKTGRSLKTWAIKGRKGAGYRSRLNKPKSGLRRYTPLTTAKRPVKSTKAQQDASRAYYKRNKSKILKAAKQRYAKNKSAFKKYAKAYRSANRPNVQYRKSQLRATGQGKRWGVGAAKNRGVGLSKGAKKALRMAQSRRRKAAGYK